ncbi:hypothetical protein [Stappia sp.]|uniref:hypothetical protein n=1 Tax=Stappia sp. TaxID=1870903 RepID=UPI003D0D201B
MSTRKTTSRTSGKATAPADKETTSTTEHDTATPDAATVSVAQPEQEPVAEPEGKATAPADKETTSTTEHDTATPDAVTVAGTQPDQEPVAVAEETATDTSIADAAPEDQAAAEEAQEGAEGPIASGVVLVITAPRARRRAGIAFGPDPVRIPVDDLTEDQLLAIESDRLLSVRAERP